MEATTKFQDIEPRHKDDIETLELDTLRTCLTNIKHRKTNIFAAMHAQNMKKITSIDTKMGARKLQDTSRAQQCTIGKPSTLSKDLDTALPTFTPAPVLPEEHHDTADKEDYGQKEATEKAKPTNAHINRATSTSTSTPVPLLIQTRPRRDLDTDFDVSLDSNQSRTSNMSDIERLKKKAAQQDQHRRGPPSNNDDTKPN